MNELYVSGSYDIGQKNAKEIKSIFGQDGPIRMKP